MSMSNYCPQCGSPLLSGLPQAPCPGCLMQLGLLAGQDTPADSFGQILALGPTFIPARDTPPKAATRKLPLPAELAELFPELEIVKLLGHGGMGAVYQARQTGLDRFVALKIIMPEVAGEPGFAERFVREARVLALLNHPHIVTIHDFGQRGGVHFLIMEFVDGVNLREVLQAGRMSSTDALRIIPGLCEALQYAHEEGVVHRDIKPENILIDRKGRVKIADFGLARMAGDVAENYTLTGTRQVVGTPRYMAPEQMHGTRTVDHRADIYSLGVVLYEMLTGEVPLGRFAPPSCHTPLDRRFDDVILRALDSDPDRRYQRASEIKSDLNFISQRPSISTWPTPQVHHQPPPDFTLPAIFQLIAGAAQIVISAGILALTLIELGPEKSWILLMIMLITPVGATCGSAAVWGAISYFATGSVWWLRWGAAALMFPCSIIWLFGMPIGLWVLKSLSRHPLPERFPPGSNSLSGSQRGKSRLVSVAMLQCITGVFAILLPVTFVFVLSAERGPHAQAESPVILVMFVAAASFVTGCLALLCGACYLAGGSSAWLKAGAVVLVLPTGIHWPFGLPVGIWSLWKLSAESGNAAADFRGQEPAAVRGNPDSNFVSAASPQTDQKPEVARWSGISWAQRTLQRIPRRRRWGVGMACLTLLLLMAVVVQYFSMGSLLAASTSGNLVSVRFWLAVGANVEARDDQGMTPLMWAAWQRHPEVVRQLLAARADVDQKGYDGETALMKAAFQGNTDIVEQLLAAGASINEADDDGETALLLAASKGHVGIIKKLLEHHADPRATTKKGWTTLMAAAINGHAAIVQHLLPLSAVNATDYRRETALIKAAANGHLAVVSELLDAQANVDQANVDGATAITFAIAGGHGAVVDELVAHHAASQPLLSYFLGFRAARAGQYAVALPLLRDAAQVNPLPTRPWIVTIDNWRYEIHNFDCYLWMLVGACEQRVGNPTGARAAYKQALDFLKTEVTEVPLFHRKLDRPERLRNESYTLRVGELSQHTQYPEFPWHLSRRFEEEERGPFHSRGSSGGEMEAVYDLFLN